MKIVVTLVILLAACGEHHDATPATPAVADKQPAGPDCGGAANHLVSFQTNGGDTHETSAAIAASCQKTMWTLAAIECVKALTSLDAAQPCMHQMTVDQNLALEDILNNSAGSN